MKFRWFKQIDIIKRNSDYLDTILMSVSGIIKVLVLHQVKDGTQMEFSK